MTCGPVGKPGKLLAIGLLTGVGIPLKAVACGLKRLPVAAVVFVISESAL